MQFEQLQKDMIAAMKERNKVRKDAISTLVSAAKKVAIDEGTRDNITEEIVDRVILKEIKTVKEQLDTCPASREDLRGEYQARYDIFQEYTPKMICRFAGPEEQGPGYEDGHAGAEGQGGGQRNQSGRGETLPVDL